MSKVANFKKNTANTVFFRYSPADISITRKLFESFFSDIGPVKKCSLIRQQRSQVETNQRAAKGYGFCKFTLDEDAVSAAKELNETEMDWEYGQKIKVWVELADAASAAKKEEEKKKQNVPEGLPMEAATETSAELLALQAKKRTARVILRNLSFYATEHNIRQIMEEKFGEVLDINLPLVPSKGNEGGKKKKPQHRGFAFVTFSKPSSAQKAVDACASDEQILIKKRPVAIDFSVSKFQHKRMKEEEDANEDNDDASDSGSDSGSDSDGSSGSDSDDNSDSSSDEDSDGDSVSTAESDEEMEDAQEKNIPQDSHKNSLFLRNLPFDTTRHDLFTLFAQYGHIAGIFLVKDRDTGIGKGTAFVRFSKEGGCMRALQAANSGDSFESGKKMLGENSSGGGLYLKGRRIFVDLAVDKGTADTLKVERDEDGKPIDKKIGKDKRNLYLKGEGRVESNEGSESNDPDAWENLPESDQQKRGRAHQEKSTKLRSPLFFINPFRLSVKNLAKHIDEVEFKNLMVRGIKNGLKKELVTKDDMIAHWRASGEMDTRAILQKITEAEKEGNLIPDFDEKHIKHYIPSVFIDRNFDVGMKEGGKGKGEKLVAPSRGFGFAEFTEHAHAVACLRELNNNTEYSVEFVTGGKRALEMKKQRSKKKKKNKKIDPNADMSEGPSGSDFVGDDGKVRIPRLIVEFTVENKAKARKQAENKAKQLENAQKQKIAAKAAGTAEDKPKKKSKGRGAKQRERKRKMRAEGLLDENGNKIEPEQSTNKKQKQTEEAVESKPSTKKKAMKPLKKPKKVDKEEKKFEDMVKSYKNTFAGISEKTEIKEPENPRKDISKKRWYEE